MCRIRTTFSGQQATRIRWGFFFCFRPIHLDRGRVLHLKYVCVFSCPFHCTFDPNRSRYPIFVFIMHSIVPILSVILVDIINILLLVVDLSLLVADYNKID